jgi:chromosome segregation ATPase
VNAPAQKPVGAGTDVAVFQTPIAEYSKTAAVLAELATKYKGVLFDVSTKEGLAAAIKGRAELRGYRVALENTRKLIKAPALKRAQEIDSEARRITAELEALETPIDDQIKADERRKLAEAEAKAKAEADRLAAEEQARKDAEQRVLAAQRAEIERQQAELAARQRAAEAEQAEARRKIEEEQRQARERIEAEQRAARQERDRLEAEAKAKRDAEEARIKAEQAAEAKRLREAEEKIAAERRAVEDAARKEREAQEERERIARAAEEARLREIARKESELLDARAMLNVFAERYGSIAEFAGILKAIEAWRKAGK